LCFKKIRKSEAATLRQNNAVAGGSQKKQNAVAGGEKLNIPVVNKSVTAEVKTVEIVVAASF